MINLKKWLINNPSVPFNDGRGVHDNISIEYNENLPLWVSLE